jgi:hypothetical protein
MMDKEIPTFDGTGDAYWWLIQLDRYYQANICILEKMKLEWVTLFALRGDAYMWCSSWKQGNQNITWENFKRAFSKKFIPDLWEMLEAAEGEEQKHHECVLKETVESDEDSTGIENKTDSGLTQNLLNRKLQSHKESMAWLDAAIEKKEADNRAMNVKVNQVVVIDSPLPESPNVFPSAKVLWETELANDVLKMETIASQVERGPTTFRPRPKPPDRKYSMELLDSNSQEQPPSVTTDSGQPVTELPRRVPPPKSPERYVLSVRKLTSGEWIRIMFFLIRRI